MDIYSSKKKAKHAKKGAKRSGTKKNIFVKFKDWLANMPKGKRTVVITLLCVVLALLIALSAIIGVVLSYLSRLNRTEIDDPEINNIVPISKEIVNIALFGIDTRTVGSFKGLSDSIMILSVNTETGRIEVISVMRDSLVTIPGYSSPNKINAAYSLGGPELAIKTLNHNFGLDIKDYATVNFYGMADIIDAVGGIEVDVSEAERTAYNGLNDNLKQQASLEGVTPQLVEKAGLQTLNGMQAVAWARIRSVSTGEGVANDYGRTDRQRYVMEQLLNKALAMSATKYPALVDALLPHMETSLSATRILSLAGVLSKEITFEQTRIPQQTYVTTGPSMPSVGSYVYYNLDFASDILHALIYEGISQDEYLEANGIVTEGWYKGSSSPTTSRPQTSASSSTPVTSSKVESSVLPVSSDTSSTESEPTRSDITTSEDTLTSEESSSVDTGTEPVSSEDASSAESSSGGTESQESSAEASSTESEEPSDETEQPTESEETSVTTPEETVVKPAA